MSKNKIFVIGREENKPFLLVKGIYFLLNIKNECQLNK